MPAAASSQFPHGTLLARSRPRALRPVYRHPATPRKGAGDGADRCRSAAVLGFRTKAAEARQTMATHRSSNLQARYTQLEDSMFNRRMFLLAAATSALLAS